MARRGKEVPLRDLTAQQLLDRRKETNQRQIASAHASPETASPTGRMIPSPTVLKELRLIRQEIDRRIRNKDPEILSLAAATLQDALALDASPQTYSARPSAATTQGATRRMALDSFDQRLFELKLLRPSRRMQRESLVRRQKTQYQRKKQGQGGETGHFTAQVNSDIAVLREQWLLAVDNACRETWLSQGNAITPEFIREVLLKRVLDAISVRGSAIRSDLELSARRCRIPGTALTPAIKHLVGEIAHLKGEQANRYEIEARELENKDRAAAQREASEAVAGLGGSKWQEFRNRFMQLADEEQQFVQRFVKETGSKDDPYIYAYRSPEKGPWQIGGGMSEDLRERVRTLVATAGTALSRTKGETPEDSWLHRLYHFLRENRSKRLFEQHVLDPSQEGGGILRVCAASATFCSSLERKAVAGANGAPRRVAPKRDGRANRKRKRKRSVGFSYSPDYRTVTVRGETHPLTAQQAKMIELLHNAQKNGNPDVSIAYILVELKGEHTCSRWQDTFKSNPKAKEALIKSGARKGTLRLKL